MRIAFGANPALGHVLPLLPLLLAARDAGHHVAVLGGAALAPTLARQGIRHVEAGPSGLPEVFQAIGARETAGPGQAVLVWSRGFAELVARPMAFALVELARTWRPDVVIHDDSEQGTWIGAEALGIPHLALQVTAWRGAMKRLSVEPANRIRAELGLAPDPALDSWHRHGFIATRPLSMRDPDDPTPPGPTDLRPVAIDDDGTTDAPWLDTRPADRRRIALTLGTVAPARRAILLRTLLDALDGIDAEVVIALGPGLDPGGFLPAPSSMRFVSYVPMSRLIPASDLVVCHAGSGTVMAALAAARPMVLLPMGADQPANAAAVASAGAGLVVGHDARTPAGIRHTVDRALADPALATAAGRVAIEIAGMPAPEAAVAALEALVDG